MSAPPLPEAFGNYALGDFVEIASPAGVSWLPQTPGWLLVGAIFGLWALHLAGRRLRHWYRNRYRREALARLHTLAEGEPSVAQINQLLKLTALAAFPRQQVAQLSGEAWVNFLDSRCPEPVFAGAAGETLAQATYQHQPPDADNCQQVLAASLRWVQHHRNLHDD